jgi:hypothetical protein
MEDIKNKVSLWLAKIDNKEYFNVFLRINYSEDGEFCNSLFGTNFMTGYYDEAFREAEILDKYSNDLSYLLENFSYDEQIILKLKETISDLDDSFNGVIMLYDYTYDGKIKDYQNKDIYCKYIGCVEYILLE